MTPQQTIKYKRLRAFKWHERDTGAYGTGFFYCTPASVALKIVKQGAFSLWPSNTPTDHIGDYQSTIDAL